MSVGILLGLVLALLVFVVVAHGGRVGHVEIVVLVVAAAFVVDGDGALEIVGR